MKPLVFRKKNVRILGISILALLLLAGCIGFSHGIVAMELGGEITSGCLLAHGYVPCQVNVGHTTTWHDAVAILSQGISGLLVLFLVSILFIASRFVLTTFHMPFLLREGIPLLHVGTRVPVARPLQTALSSGLLHGRVF